MKIHDPSSQAMQKDYEVSDIERLMSKRDWKNYDEVITWLQKEGDEDRRFTPGEVQRMIDDFSRARDKRVDFVRDPEQLHQKLKSTR
jgi:DNA primase catalytic subunit